MNKFFTDFSTYFLAPLIIIIGQFVALPDLCDGYKKEYPNGFVIVEAFSIAGAIFVYGFSIFSPYRKYQKLQNRKYEIMQDQLKALNKNYDNLFEFSLNIMLVKNEFFVRSEPSKTAENKINFNWRNKVFHVLREHGDGVDKKLKFTINQGVCGEAFRKAEHNKVIQAVGIIVGGPHDEKKDMNLSNLQKELTKDLIIVVSCPIIIEKGEGDSLKREVIGVVNIHSKKENSVLLLTNQDNARVIFYEKIQDITTIFARLHV